MKKMNKRIWKKGGMALMAVLAAAVMGLAGCGSAENDAKEKDAANPSGSNDKAQSDNNNENSGQASGYVFKSNGVTIGVDVEAEPIVEALGEPVSKFEEPSCAAQGTAYLYSYSGFEINTYPDGDKNYIAYILLKDDTVATPEGVDLSKTRDDIIAAYGEGYEEEGKTLTYKKDGMTLNFMLDDDGNIISIEYDSSVLNGTSNDAEVKQ